MTDLEDDFESQYEENLNANHSEYKWRRSRYNIPLGFFALGSFANAVFEVLAVMGFNYADATSSMGYALGFYYFVFIVLIASKAIEIFDVNTEIYERWPQKSRRKWFSYVGRHFQFGFSYTILLIFLLKLKS